MSPSQVPMNNNPEGASSLSSDNMKPDKNNLGGDGPAREEDNVDGDKDAVLEHDIFYI